MKVALLLPNNLWFCPYANIYIELLKEWKIKYDIIYWNRDNNSKEEGIGYNYCKNIQGSFNKFLGYYTYSRFLKKIIKKNKYDRLIVFSPQIGIFISKFLKKNYSRKYIFDYRDLSIEQNKLFKYPFLRLLDNSYSNVISSLGFTRCLPKRDYILSHNFNISEVEKALVPNAKEYPTNPNEILTIGGIRDFKANSQIILALSNKKGFILRFVGRGPSQKSLEEFAKINNTNNISFEGYYPKEDEPNYIKEATFLNIFYPNLLSHATALSNRFYNSLIYRRPMIVTKGQIQGDYAEKYSVGIVVSDPSKLPEQLEEWIKNTNFIDYQERCISLLNKFTKDYDKFKYMFQEFLNI